MHPPCSPSPWLALVAAPAAFGASGSLNDPDDDGLADVLRLSYANKQTRSS